MMDPFGPDFPYEGLSGNVKDALSNIQQQNLGGFCSELISVIEADDNDDDDDNGGGGSFQPSKSSSSNINSNGNSNSNVDTGGSGSSRSSSSSYSNSNGRITGSVTGPGGYSYTYSNSETIGPSGEASSTSNYYINGVRVPEALTGYQPMTIQSACEQTKKEGTDTGHG